MNKTASCIKLIQILQGRDEYLNTNDLAELLDTNPRNIREYFKELEALGYEVLSKKGLYGGYKLSKTSTLPSVNFSFEEEADIKAIRDYLKENNEDLYNKYVSLAGKVEASREANKLITPLKMVDKFPLDVDVDLVEKIYNDFRYAITNKLKCEITYMSQSDKLTSHVVHPYKLFVYNGSYFLLGFTELRNDFAYFKLHKINSIYVTQNNFEVQNEFNELNYLDEFGVKQRDPYLYYELKISNLNQVLKDRLFGRNQHVKILDERNLILSFETQNKKAVLAFALSLAENCEVISPTSLREDIKNALVKMSGRYEND